MNSKTIEIKFNKREKIMNEYPYEGMPWDDIYPEDQEALIEWYNIVRVNDEDRRALTELFGTGKFSHWTCPICDTWILVGSPDDWGDFQGVNQSEHIGELCQDCADNYFKLKHYAEE